MKVNKTDLMERVTFELNLRSSRTEESGEDILDLKEVSQRVGTRTR